jgi:predicted DNA-binding WGR domain protein
MHIYLECRQPLANKNRFYAMHVTKTLFGEWAVIREWGRNGAGRMV